MKDTSNRAVVVHAGPRQGRKESERLEKGTMGHVTKENVGVLWCWCGEESGAMERRE